MRSGTKYLFLVFIFLFSADATFAQKGKTKPKSSKYEFQGPYCNGLARVKNAEKKWGFIDTTGGVVVPLKYNEVTNFVDGRARVRIGQKWGLIDTKGTVLRKPTFQSIGDFVNGVAKVLLEGEEYYMNMEGMRCDKNGKPVVNGQDY